MCVVWFKCLEKEVVSWVCILYRKLANGICHCSFAAFYKLLLTRQQVWWEFQFGFFPPNFDTNLCDERPAALSQIFKHGEVSVKEDGFTKEYLRNSSSVIYFLSFNVPSAADYVSRAPGELI